MIPKLATNGSSFAGAGMYYLHDKGADTTERVGWTQTLNMLTDDPEKALKVMAFTALHAEEIKQLAGVKSTGRKMQNPVCAFSLSWEPGHEPDKAHMLATAHEAIETLGLSEHEAIIVQHVDEEHAHVHVLANRCHPETGKVNKLSNSKKRLSEFALAYEQQHGIVCQQRVDNAEQRTQGKNTKYRDPVIQKAWERSDSGKAFAAALQAEGYTLAQGRKRVVVVDRYGKSHNPLRHLDGVKKKEMNARLQDIDQSKLPKAEQVEKWIKQAAKKQREAKRDLTKEASRGKAKEAFTNEARKSPARPEAKENFNRATAQHKAKDAFTKEAKHPQAKDRARQASGTAGKTAATREEESPEHQAFNEWVAFRRAELHSKQLEEKGDIHNGYTDRRRRKNNELGEYYETVSVKREIGRLKKSLDDPGLVVDRLTGKARENADRLEALEKQLENIQWRTEEQLAIIDKDCERAMIDLQMQHEHEEALLFEQIATCREQVLREERRGYNPLGKKAPYSHDRGGKDDRDYGRERHL